MNTPIRQRGFTLVELVLVIAITATLSVILFQDRSTVAAHDALWLDAAADMLRHSRSRAVAERCEIRVDIQDRVLSAEYTGSAAQCPAAPLAAPDTSGTRLEQHAPVLSYGVGTHQRVFDPYGRALDADGTPQDLQLRLGARRLVLDGRIGSVVVEVAP